MINYISGLGFGIKLGILLALIIVFFLLPKKKRTIIFGILLGLTIFIIVAFEFFDVVEYFGKN